MKLELEERARKGLISAVPNGLLTLYNYTNQCVYEKSWDEYTMAARGLILNESGEVVARPWPKFFNLNERPDSTMESLPKETPEMSEKYDGSMVIVFYDQRLQKWRAVTRGCWDNVQTQYATKWLAQHAHKLDYPYTHLFELVAPWNRIVLPYNKEDMILIGLVLTSTGMDSNYGSVNEYATQRGLSPVKFWKQPIDSLTLEDATVQDKEGYVARYSNGFRVKLKYKQYLYLHKILTGFSIKGIWEVLSSGQDPMLEGVPDEFMDWYRKQREILKSKYAAIEAQAKAVFASTPKHESRKGYALDFMKHKDISGILFSMLDGTRYADTIWNKIKPHGKTSVFSREE